MIWYTQVTRAAVLLKLLKQDLFVLVGLDLQAALKRLVVVLVLQCSFALEQRGALERVLLQTVLI